MTKPAVSSAHEATCGVHFGSVSCTCGALLGGAGPLTTQRDEMLRALDGPWELVHDEGDDRREEARILTASNRLVSYVKLNDTSAALWIGVRTLVNEYVAKGGDAS